MSSGFELSRSAELLRVCNRIPAGRVASYGSVGRQMGVSGLVAGKWLDNWGDQTCWWRVVGSKGDLLTARRDAGLAMIQRALLESEGVDFDSQGRVMATFFVDLDSLIG
ncbi:MAG: MGMT family protein [Armatimonadetes bacterium]|nr:MGMT family protein [Armatimonadota bacterium]